MDKEKVITKITDVGVVAVVRAESSDQAIRIADACIEGGIPAIELTFTVPRANKVIEDLAAKYSHGEIILGAGTINSSPSHFLLVGSFILSSLEPS